MVVLHTSWFLHIATEVTVYILGRANNNYVLINQGVLNSGVSFNRSSTVVDVVSHHSILQVHLGPTGEEQLYHISVSTATGLHEGSLTPLRNTMRQNSNYHM